MALLPIGIRFHFILRILRRFQSSTGLVDCDRRAYAARIRRRVLRRIPSSRPQASWKEGPGRTARVISSSPCGEVRTMRWGRLEEQARVMTRVLRKRLDRQRCRGFQRGRMIQRQNV